jgi:hypothetical protein
MSILEKISENIEKCCSEVNHKIKISTKRTKQDRYKLSNELNKICLKYKFDLKYILKIVNS